ncbi:DUF4397 domain-containing protein [Streptomyces sp. NPDC002580]|uniref:DUF4397 domain-containing protein n=1 Tax=Streptomyces sp. NPDC002580 TaxID=3364653 RepID=UPI0036908BF6
MTSPTSYALAASAGALALALGVTAPVTAAPADTTAQAMVSVFHGIPGATVDVYADGQRLLDDFKPGTVTKPQPLDAGTYDIQVYPADQGPGDGTPVVKKQIKVAAGAEATVAAHLSTGGDPQLTAYNDDVAPVADGKTRLTVRHVAAAPAVDVRAGGQPIFVDLTNPNQEGAAVDAGTVNADVVLANTDTVVIGPADLDLTSGTSTILYAWGSAQDDNLKLTPQVLDAQ